MCKDKILRRDRRIIKRNERWVPSGQARTYLMLNALPDYNPEVRRYVVYGKLGIRLAYVFPDGSRYTQVLS